MSDPQQPADPEEQPHPPDSGAAMPAVIPADEIFRGAREVIIEHEGKRYLLRITRRHKLILTRA